ncbi:MAG TPA: cyclic nucleotide-binding domain-containing protein [Bacteroidota bacterium]|nr:cyclic nucleotide-binding domain-containing protein [Bacteroidota bacterium]
MTTPWDRLLGARVENGQRKPPFTAVLSRVPIFENLSKHELASIDRILHRREYLPDEIVFRQGEPGMGMYVVQTGKVAIVSEPQNQQLYEMQEGDFFGEVALLDEGPRSATAVARSSCTLLGFFQPDLFDLISRNPRLGVKVVLSVARHVGVRLRQADDWVTALTVELEALRKKHTRHEEG